MELCNGIYHLKDTKLTSVTLTFFFISVHLYNDIGPEYMNIPTAGISFFNLKDFFGVGGQITLCSLQHNHDSNTSYFLQHVDVH